MKLKYIALTLAMAVTLTFTACSEAENTAVSETTVSETTAKYTDEELEVLSENMPEIVFVMSHHYDDTNILGYYVTNTGEIKLYDFRQTAPNEIYEIPDVYDRLEEAVCSEIAPNIYWNEETYQEQIVSTDKLKTIVEDDLTEQYKKLLLVNSDSEYLHYDSMLGSEGGCYNGYGIRYNENNENEVVLLYSGGEYIFQCYDDYANELYGWLRFEEVFPDIPEYNNIYS